MMSIMLYSLLGMSYYHVVLYGVVHVLSVPELISMLFIFFAYIKISIFSHPTSLYSLILKSIVDI